MKSTRNMYRLFAAIVAIAALDASARAQTPDKFQFRLNWTLYGEHAPLSFPKIISAHSDDAIRTRLVW